MSSRLFIWKHTKIPRNPKLQQTQKQLTENSGPIAFNNLDAVAAQSLQQTREEAAAGQHLLAQLHREVLVLLGDSAADRERACHRHEQKQLQL